MEISELTGKLVGLDTAPLIYFMEQNPRFYPPVKAIFENNALGEFDFVISVLTLTEVLIHPLQQGDTALTNRYKAIFKGAKGVRIADMNSQIAETAAQLRAKYSSVRTPDAIQLATAIHHDCDLFLSNDEALKKVTEIAVVTIADFL